MIKLKPNARIAAYNALNKPLPDRYYVPLVNTPQPCCDQCGYPTVADGLCETVGCPNDIQAGS